MANFEIQPLERFRGPSKAIKRPTEIACFSYDEEHIFHLDASSLKYYYPPSLGASLSSGFDTFKKLDETHDEHLDSLLATIIDLERRSGETVDADVITWRGMITKIMTAPYGGNFDGFEMNATCFQGTIFIEENRQYKLESWQNQRSQPTGPSRPSQDLMSYWGYKFETLCLLPNTWNATPREYIEGRESEIVSNHAQYCSVVKTSIGDTKLIIGGEVDAVWDARSTDPANRPTNWVELKTAAEMSSANDALKFERKLQKFWAQSFLLGVPKIIVGFRSSGLEGRLLRIQEFETTKIPGTVKREGSASWDGNICVNFTASFLTFLRSVVDGDGGVWRIVRRERSNVVQVQRLEANGYGGILSKDFLEWRQQR